MKRFILLPFLIAATPAHGATDYGSTVARLRANQAAIDQSLKTLGAGYGFADEETSLGRPSDESTPKRKLLTIHGDLRASVLPSGKLIFGKTLSRLVVSSDGAPALIELDDQQGPVSGLRIMGTARSNLSLGRIQVEFTKLLLPQRAIPIQASALDGEGAQGLVAQVFSSKAWAVAGAMAGSFIAGLASAQQTQTMGALGFSQPQPTGRNAILQGVAQTAADQSKRLIDDATAEKPVLVVEPGTEVTVLIQEEVRF